MKKLSCRCSRHTFDGTLSWRSHIYTPRTNVTDRLCVNANGYLRHHVFLTNLLVNEGSFQQMKMTFKALPKHGQTIFSWDRIFQGNLSRLILVVTVAFTCSSFSVVNKSFAEAGTLNLGVLIPWTQEWEIGHSMGSAIVVGVEEVERRQLLPGYNITWQWRDTYCKPRQGLSVAVDLWRSFGGNLSAFIGGGCSVVCEPVALLSAAWDLPLVSFGCTSDTLSNKYNYPTFSRSVGTWLSLAPMFDKMADSLGWTRVGIVTTTENIMQLTANAIKYKMEESGKEVIYRTIETTVDGMMTNRESLQRQREVVADMKQQARIIILMMYDNDVLNWLLSAYDEGMINGDYVHIGLDIYPGTWKKSDRREAARQAFQGFISGNVRKPSGPEWDAFTEKVRLAFNDHRFDGFQKIDTADEVDVHAGMLHDAVLQWAYGVNKTLQEGGSPTGGTDITASIINSTFVGITGIVAIGDKGDRKPDYSIEIVHDDKYITMFEFLAHNETLVKVRLTGISWPAGTKTVPKDGPVCGWDDELCPNNAQTIIIIIAAGLAGFVVILTFVAAGIYRKMKFEADLNAINLWKIAWEEIKSPAAKSGSFRGLCRQISRQFSIRSTFSDMELGVCNPYGSFRLRSVVQQRYLSRSSFSRTAIGNGSITTEKQIFTEVALYKGKTVAVKKMAATHVHIQDRRILLEFKQVRSMNHENVNPFIGACVDAPNICIVMMYAQKGSLQDVLQNDDVNLTWDFRMSIATDIAKGMMYVHDSDIGSHGRLTSSNCVIDGRWVCKITDYGLGLFKTKASLNHKKSYYSNDGSPHTELLWRAPELLRCPESEFSLYGTKEGDVYSYGIIIHEIALKDAPYSCQPGDIDISQVVNRVKASEDPPYRPYIPRDACSSGWAGLMSRCWAENPENRPHFLAINRTLRAINGGRSVNVIDNMLSMLEQHAEHLEDLVAERTQELDDEKKKVETLLYNILPRSVADQLKQGKQVDPEVFESVTIYFSDIVGFTKLAAGSTPMQVVNLLNELYSLFDGVSDKYDVYKVETIGDAYMVVSGLPIRNGDKHASEICTMALHLLSAISTFRIPHIPHQQLQLRIGVHTGPVVAGVVGKKMPRFCLFGDTVNTASRMESNSMALRIHLSQFTQVLLQKGDMFELECRGEIEVKGKGSMTTYWLNGKKDWQLPLPDLTRAASLEEHEFK